MNSSILKNEAEESIDRVFATLRAETADDVTDSEIYRTIAIATREILNAVLNCSTGDCSCLEHKTLRCPVCGFDNVRA
jgi:hypothetical protein